MISFRATFYDTDWHVTKNAISTQKALLTKTDKTRYDQGIFKKKHSNPKPGVSLNLRLNSL